MQDAVNGLLQWAATIQANWAKAKQIGERFAKSLGLIETSEDLTLRSVSQNWPRCTKQLRNSMMPTGLKKKKPLFLNGRAQPIFSYTTGEKADQDYKYEDSQIVRFPVYVETDYDTDADGKPDLVKAIVQFTKSSSARRF